MDRDAEILGDHPETGWIESAAICISVAIIVNVAAGTDYFKERMFQNLSKQLESSNKKVVVRSGEQIEVQDKDIVVGDILTRITGIDQRLKFEAEGTCYLEFGDGNVAQISANYLGQDEPEVSLEEPSAELREGKQHFEDDRLDRWFNRPD